MNTAVATTNAADTFRASAAGVLHAVADMSLHELVDEFQRMTDRMAAGRMPNPKPGSYPDYVWSEDAQVAAKQRGIVVGAAKARFGIAFEAYDRSDDAAHPF